MINKYSNRYAVPKVYSYNEHTITKSELRSDFSYDNSNVSNDPNGYSYNDYNDFNGYPFNHPNGYSYNDYNDLNGCPYNAYNDFNGYNHLNLQRQHRF